MNKRDETASELTTAARELDEELKRFEDATEAVMRMPLSTQKNLERAGKGLAEVADIDERLAQRVQRLVGAITAARQKQQAQAQRIADHALEVQRRAELFQALQVRYGGLGEEAHALQESLQAALPKKGELATADDAAALQQRLTELSERIARLAETAHDVARQAETDGFEDVVRQADSLRHQLLAALNRLMLLQKSQGQA
ncbi:MAG: hypothetical protein ACK4N5_21640 [Myxococcales bacterium]